MIHDWNQTALLAALQTVDASIEDFHPFAERREPSVMPYNPEVLQRIQDSGQ